MKAELAEIDENLVRHNLNHVDDGKQLLRCKEIYEVLNPETKAGIAGEKAGGEARRTNETVSPVHPKSFVDDTAEKIGIIPCVVQMKTQVARDLTPDTKKIVREHEISEKNFLKLARIKEPEKQKKVAENIFKKVLTFCVTNNIINVSPINKGG